jgi:hypothetical protein
MIWLFVAMMTFADGSVEQWPAVFPTAESCEEFRADLPNWLEAHASEIGIVSATWDAACRAEVDPSPLDPHSDGHSH